MRTFVMGDIHGAHLALKQCLERSGFDKENDRLIQLGDVCDGWPYVYECVEELLTIKNRIDLLGNHDEWFINWMDSYSHPDYWCQGGYATAISYQIACGQSKTVAGSKSTGYFPTLDPGNIPDSHKAFFKGQQHYVLLGEQSDRLFVHAGFDRGMTLEETMRDNPAEFLWDRKLWLDALVARSSKNNLRFFQPLKEIFIGHTATTSWSHDEQNVNGIVRRGKFPITEPINADIIWNLDTGAGWSGKLTIMDIDTKEYWQSDLVTELYKGIRGR